MRSNRSNKSIGMATTAVLMNDIHSRHYDKKLCGNYFGGGGGGVSRPSMSAYVLSFLDSMRQRTCFLGHWRTLTDIGGLGRTLADSNGH